MKLQKHWQNIKETITSKKNSNLIIGLTGTIASGKTTVADMLTDLGAYAIDFDLLAREIVIPGALAYNQIVDYFGKQILQEDGNLDRKKLSDIVFSDIEKRKILESFTHPQIALSFVSKLDNIILNNANAIVQVIVPLMIENNLQYLFHKVILVYIPQDKLVERLMKRNSINYHEAIQIINSQIPIDEKVKFADFVIDNGKELDQTKQQVDNLWGELVKIQRKERNTKIV